MLRTLLGLAVALAAVTVAAQPARILDINPSGSDAVSPRSTFSAYQPDNVVLSPFHWNRFVTLRGEAHFTATDGTTGIELWRTDGSAEGTTLVADLAPGAASSLPSTPVRYDGALYFTASTSGTSADRALYRYDGFGVSRVSDRNLLPYGASAAGLILADSDGMGFVLRNGSIEPLQSAMGAFLPAPIVASGRRGGYFVSNGVMFQTNGTPETTVELFPDRRTDSPSAGSIDVIGAVGQPYLTRGGILFDCFYARRQAGGSDPGDEQGVELCQSSGVENDVSLVQDFRSGPQSPDFSFVGVYGGELYAVGRTPGDPADFLLYKTSGESWQSAAANTTEFYRNTSASDVRMLEAGGSVGYVATRARSSAPFPVTELAFFRSDGSRVTNDGTRWATVRTAGANGNGFLVATTGSPEFASTLYQWDGGDRLVDLGPLPQPSFVKAFGTGVLMNGGGELWGYGIGRLSARRALTGTGAAAFDLSLGALALPFSLDVSALGSGGEVQASLLLASRDSLSAAPPPEATAVLDPFYRLADDGGLAGLSATVTVSYNEDEAAALGVSERDLVVWKTDGVGGWTRLAIVSRDAAANTITAGPIDGFSDFIVGTTSPVSDGSDPDDAAFVLSSPRPNPSGRHAAVTISLGTPADVRVHLFDALGREVARLHDGRLGAGSHGVEIRTASLAPGLYAVRATAGTETRVQRLVVIR